MKPDPGTRPTDLTDDELDSLGRRAGAALRRDAPTDGTALIRRDANRSRATSVLGKAGVVAVVGIATFAVVTSRSAQRPEPATVAPVPTTTQPTTVTSSAPGTSLELTNAPASTNPTATDPPDPISTAPPTTSIAPEIGETLAAGQIRASDLAFDPDSGMIVTGVSSGLATVDPLTLQVVDSAGCPSIDVGGKLGAISVGDLDLLRRLDEILDTSASGPGGEVCTIDVSDDGRLLASSRATGTAGSDVPQYVTSIVALPSGDPIGQVSGRDPLFSPSSGLLVTSGFGEVAVWDPLTSTEVAVVERFSGSARRAEFTADGEWLITTGRQGLRLWDGATFEPGPNFDPGLFSNQVFSAALDPSGAMIAGATFAGVGVWDGATGELLFENDVGQRGEPHDCGGTMCHGGEVFEVRWSPDGSMLLTGGTDDAVRVIDATTGAELGTIGACSVDGSGYRVAAWINADTIVVVDVGNACSELVRIAGAT